MAGTKQFLTFSQQVEYSLLFYPLSSIQINKLSKFDRTFKICTVFTCSCLIIEFKTNIIQSSCFCL